MAEECRAPIPANSSIARPPRFWRISSRELLLVTALVGVGFAVLKYAAPLVWSIMGIAALLVFLFFAVVAAPNADRCRDWRWALWFARPAMSGLCWPGPIRNRTRPVFRQLPTMRAVLPLFQAMSENYYVDSMTRERLPDDDPRVLQYQNRRSQAFGDGFGSGGFGGSFGPSVTIGETPYRGDFMPIVHIPWAAFFGYLGGRLDYFLTLRRMYREAQGQKSAS